MASPASAQRHGTMARMAAASARQERWAGVGRGAALLTIVVILGTSGYYVLAHGEHSMMTCFYMTIVTLSTVGYGEVIPISSSTGLQVFTTALIFFGAGSLLYFLSSFTAILVEGDLAHGIWRRRMQRRMSEMRDHIIVAGLGSNGLHVARDLLTNNLELVAVDNDTAAIDNLLSEFGDGVTFLVGDALDAGTLVEAGLERAQGIIATLPDDRDNIFLCLTVRHLSPTIRIVSKVDEPSNEAKLTSVGANSVVSPTHMGGQRLVSQMIRPSVVSLADALFVTDREMGLTPMSIASDSAAAGKRLGDFETSTATGATVIAVAEGPGETYRYNPPTDTVLQAGGAVIALGDDQELAAMRALVSTD